ncbi:MAG: hypothetical protein QOJ71_156 [Actinomycetota bacterium]|nr:hypothetical protein [Actinomycetota bacterium]
MQSGSGGESGKDALASQSNASPESSKWGPRQRILAAASGLFYRNGVHAVGVDTIIASARVAKASFYYHFKSKDDLIVIWLSSGNTRWLERFITEIEQRSDDPKVLLLAFFDVLSDLVESDDFRGCPYLNTAAELRSSDGPVRAVVADFCTDVRSYLEGLAASAGLREPREVGAALHILITGVFAASLALGNSSPAHAARAAAAELVEAAS